MEELKKEQDRYVNKIFWLGFQSSLIFGVPALLAVFIGKKLDYWFGTAKLMTVILLCLAFISSWAVILRQYYRLNKKLKEVNSAIKKEKLND